MESVSLDGVEVDRCTSCQGLWFDALEDRDLRKSKAAASLDTGSKKVGAKNDTQGKIECPRCHTRMIRMVDREQPHVWYESCGTCHGSYFDAGEFKDLRKKGLSDLLKRWRRGERPLS
jgi:Zn-finger nucleic acid-binding protein